MDRTKIAVAPKSRPPMCDAMAAAVVAAGAEIVPVTET